MYIYIYIERERERDLVLEVVDLHEAVLVLGQHLHEAQGLTTTTTSSDATCL